jgi:hypothetical protein
MISDENGGQLYLAEVLFHIKYAIVMDVSFFLFREAKGVIPER